MKKLLLFLTFVCAILLGYSQNGCTPDPQFTVAGVYPDSAIGLTNAYVGQAYSENITLITPLDTTVPNPIGGTMTVTIDSINLTSVTGLPLNFGYTCDPPNCSFLGGTSSCAELYSIVNPTIADTGVYPIIFETTTYLSNVPLIGTTSQNDIIDYYTITISATNLSAIFDKLYNYTFELRDVLPNPVNDQSKIQFITGEPNDIVFSLFYYLGEKIEERNIAASRGVNDISINANNYPNGMFLYSINNGVQIVSKRMVIAN